MLPNEIIYIVAHLLVCLVLINKISWFQSFGLNIRFINLIFILKVICGIIAGVLYLKYYNGGDTFIFFKDGLQLKNLLIHDPSSFWKLISGNYTIHDYNLKYNFLYAWMNEDILYNDNRTVIIIHALISFFSGNFYNVHVIWFALFSTTGLIGIFHFFRQNIGYSNLILSVIIFCTPSVLFWLSVPSKESVLIGICGLLCSCFSAYRTGSQPIKLVAVLFLIFASFYIKLYWALLFVPALFALFLSVQRSSQKPWKIFLTVYGTLVSLTIGLSFLFPAADISHIIFMKRFNFDVLVNLYPQNFHTLIQLPELNDSWFSLIGNLPAALMIGIAQPFIFFKDQPVILLFSVENAVYIILSVYAIIKYRSRFRNVAAQPFFWFCLFFSLSLLALIGLTIPVAGALVRYKAPLLPFVLMIPVMFTLLSNLKHKT